MVSDAGREAEIWYGVVVRPPGCQAGRLTDWICTHFSLTDESLQKGNRKETQRGDERRIRREGEVSCELLEIGAVRVRWDWDYGSRGEVLWRKRALDGSLLGVAKHCTLSSSMSN